MSRVLITGCSGMVGLKLAKSLQLKGHEVIGLGREAKIIDGIQIYKWNISNSTADDSAFQNIDYVVHLAGESVADKNWSVEQKKIIVDSRVKTANLVATFLQKNNCIPKAVVSASGTGFYGNDTSTQLVNEDSEVGTGFLAQVCKQWEESAYGISPKSRTVILRIGMVLSENGGAIPVMLKPVKLGIGSPLGSGNQLIAWIHINDLVGMIEWSLFNENLSGVYNSVAPEIVTNKNFMKQLAQSVNAVYWAPAVPSFVLRLLLGEKAAIVLYGNNVSVEKTQKAGYSFLYPTLENALKNILQK